MGLTVAVDRLESMRAELEAASLTATFDTRHGMVSLVVTPGGSPRVFVNGEEVGREQEP